MEAEMAKSATLQFDCQNALEGPSERRLSARKRMRIYCIFIPISPIVA